MPTYVSPFTGTVVTPTDVSYFNLSFSTNQTLAWPSAVNPPEVPAARIIDCTPSTSGLYITLPPANEGTTGADILFRNLGSHSFIVQDAAGGETLTVDPNISKYLYLADNTSIGGVWHNVTFGAGTSSADAASLAGPGLVALVGKLATTQVIGHATSDQLLSDSSRAETFVWDGGVGTFTLPPTSGLSQGWYVGFRNGGTGTLTLQPSGLALINGQTSLATNPGDSGFIMYDVSTLGFVTVGWQTSANVSFTAATYDVDAVIGDDLNLVSFAPIIQTYISQSETRTTDLLVTLPAITQVYMIVNNTSPPPLTNYSIKFKNEGSLETPIELPPNNTLIMLSDGLSLYPLTQTSTGTFYAANGSANLPSYTFQEDTHTGLYKVGTSVLGVAANGVQIAEFNNVSLASPVVTLNARLVAELINGGTF